MANKPLSRVVGHLRRVALLQEADRLSDAQLIESFLARGEEAAFEVLVRRYGPMILGVCRRVLRDRHDADDAFQATFLVFLRKVRAIRKRTSLASWLYGVAHRTALQARKATARRRAKERQVEDMASKQSTRNEATEDLLPLLDQELSRLPEKYRSAVLLCDLEGKTRKKAALQLGIPEPTLSMRLDRGRAMLARRLSRRGSVLTGAAVALALSQQVASAAVPPSLVSSTVKVSAWIVAGNVGAAVAVSAKVVALTEGVMKTMLLTKLKTMVMVLSTITLVGAGGTLISRDALLGQPAPAKEAVTQQKAAETRSAQDASSPMQPKKENDENAIRALIGQLGDESFEKREEAEKKLIAAGKPALPLLNKAATDTNDAEVRERVTRVLRALRSRPGAGLLFPGANVFDIVLSKDGQRMAVGCYDGGIRIYDVQTGELKQTLKGHTAKVYGLVYSRDGKKLASCAGFHGGIEPREIIVWNVATGAAEAKMKDAPGDSCWITFSPDEKNLYTCGWDGTIRMWDIATKTELRAAPRQTDAVRRVVFTPDGKFLASAGMDGTVRFWQPENLQEVKQILAHPNGVGTLTFSPDGKYLITASRAGAPPTPGAIKVWDMATLMEKTTLRGHTSKILSLAVSPDSTLLAMGGGFDTGFGEVMLFELATGAVRARFTDHKEWVECVTFSPDGNWLASGGGFTPTSTGEVRIWDVKRLEAKGE